MTTNAVTIFGIGILFCIAGIYLFQRNVFEENRKITNPLLVIVAGVILIGLGTAKCYHLVK